MDGHLDDADVCLLLDEVDRVLDGGADVVLELLQRSQVEGGSEGRGRFLAEVLGALRGARIAGPERAGHVARGVGEHGVAGGSVARRTEGADRRGGGEDRSCHRPGVGGIPDEGGFLLDRIPDPVATVSRTPAS